MKRKLGTVAVCGALMFSFGGAAAAADSGPVDRGGISKKCQKLFDKYDKAIKKGQTKKADKLSEKIAKEGCAG